METEIAHLKKEEEIRRILNSFDPMEFISDGAPEDEYDSERELILPALESSNTFEEFYEKTYQIFIYMFDADTAGQKRKYKKLAEEIYNLKNQ